MKGALHRLSGQLDILHDAMHNGDADLNAVDASARPGEGAEAGHLEADLELLKKQDFTVAGPGKLGRWGL